MEILWSLLARRKMICPKVSSGVELKKDIVAAKKDRRQSKAARGLCRERHGNHQQRNDSGRSAKANQSSHG